MKTFFKIIIVTLILITAIAIAFFVFREVRQPAVVGEFYPADKKVLQSQVNTFLNQVSSENNLGTIKAILVPHASYEYSGQVAAYSYNSIKDQEFDTVIILGNSHQEHFDGMAIDGNSFWKTPLGKVELDKELIEKLTEQSNIFVSSDIHRLDHVLEVQLPFLQTVLSNKFKIVPILFGNQLIPTYRFLENYLTDKTLIVVSSDLSHYPNYDDANEMDKKTLELIAEKNIITLAIHSFRTPEDMVNVDTLMCSEDAIRSAMVLAENLNWQVEILDYKNSGDSLFGNKERVVGYGSAAFYSLDDLKQEHKDKLVNIAKESIKEYLISGTIKDFDITDPRLLKSEGAFVSLYKDNNLRGCIGQIVSSGEALWENVRSSAILAATKDDRFISVNQFELEDLNYEISVLSKLTQLEKWQDFKLGEEGILIKKDDKQGVFLPQVAKQSNWSKEEFLSHLCEDKAGLDSGAYKNDSEVELFVFTAQVFSDK